MVYIEALILIVVLSYLLYKWSTRKYHILAERGVSHEKPKPLIGNIDVGILLGKTSFFRSFIDNYLKYKQHKVFGSYSFSEPFFIIHDVELIKKIGIKDFDHFANHQRANVTAKDTVLAKNLMALKDRRWKEMRNTLTPSFTGSKMRAMHEFINDCCLEGVRYIEDEIKANGGKEYEMETKDYFTRFANDVIGTVAFGIKVNSFKDKTNTFYITGHDMTQPRGWRIVKGLLFVLMPKVMKALRIRLLDPKMMAYFHDLVFDAIKYRQEHGIVRPDMIHLLLEARRNFEADKSVKGEGHATFDDDDLLAQCLIFFLAGFETVSSCLCFTLHELLSNPEVQQRLYEEIVETEAALDGKPMNYDVLVKMEYLDMVISESLRKWPPAGFTDRLVGEDYKLTDEAGNLVVELKKGDQILIPIMGLQNDPEFFPEPAKFDPERFSEENKKNIIPYSYLPFGIGPRNCIGSRLALMEVKLILYHLVKNFQLSAAAKTATDLLDAIKGFRTMPKDKFPVKFTPRNN